MDNPIKFIDPDGRSVESTHTDENGRVIAVYDDGDLGIYRHSNISAGTHIDGAKSYVDQMRAYTGTTGGGGELINPPSPIKEIIDGTRAQQAVEVNLWVGLFICSRLQILGHYRIET